MKRVLFRPQAVRDLESLGDKDRDLVEAAMERFAATGVGDIKLLAGADRHYRGAFVLPSRSQISFVFSTSEIGARRTDKLL